MRSLVMRCFSFCKDGDIERQGPKNDDTGSEKKKTIKRAIGQVVNHPLTKKIISKTAKFFSETAQLPAWCFHYFHWDVAFLVVCVVAIAVDPLFFYLPVINEATKCIAIDTTLKITAICVRSFLDLIALGDLVARKINNCPDMKSSDYVINILSILPVHQVLMPIIFSEMKTSKIENKRKFLNAVVLLQYVPRIFRIYRLWKIVNETIILPKRSTKENVESDKNLIPPKGFLVMKAGFNLLLYLVASHALGACWYFFSIQRETTCWYKLACERDINECSKGISLDCGTGGFGNYTFLNDLCSIENPNTTLFDFGIFEDARQSGILSSMDFPRKTMFCFWWGLQNLSSLGQNLQTSTYYWENCFTVLISIFGLLLFLYFIGNLQVYMQWEASNELEEIKSKWLKNKEEKLHSIENWISTMVKTDHELEKKIMDYVKPKLEDQNNNFDAENPFPHLSEEIRSLIKIKLCSPLLQKVPKFQESEELLSKHLKHVQYKQNRLIVGEGKSLNEMIFVVKGIVCTCTSNHDDKTDQCPDKCEIIGENLVQWVLESPKQSNPPSSEKNFKCLTKVEAFRLTARDLNDIFQLHPSKECGGDSTTPSIPYFKKIPSLLCSHCSQQLPK
ncbi:cyclic nucleotide-gated ion channel 1-like [Carya illinoinensis]|uniref:cyclic nucleotide-gated ion channel 1-like n=1 Tax=Carya illinoinensis TaxID=32201 RepID=UPI001C728950|nr:cyclic nucleotide-gated ion channel 1-like [Carya illinoinensis]XP_042985878.1 cyclic nucleotide-gated ion channel 1-like [Carya illinoinensis]XP_042985879.1 cyclic nucleotide-gated ion channel 1-like [Carya illinoinensis]XP_042985880.1 cyclic nucleotide-gated ion channel 1-like [Carya illinoinensis]XP_042985881.1 cyclic nucleotide-gated ion channel 1-like [Carya illinoinensis]XP_042985882.1 cyclic nucleotide-gated ion channel 1-like [Carya illinoinensis]